MNLKKRITIAVAIICMLPIVLSLFAMKLLVNYWTDNLSDMYDVRIDSELLMKNPMAMYSDLTGQYYDEVRSIVRNDPAMIEDEEFLTKKNAELGKIYSFLVLRKGESIVYCGNRDLAGEIIGSLPGYGSQLGVETVGVYTLDQKILLIKKLDGLTTGRVPYSLFFITDINQVIPRWEGFFGQMVMAIICILALTAMVLVAWLYQSIARPLAVLRMATQQIASGNLNYKIRKTPDDEIGQLQKDFELMRVHLKENIEKQIQYEEMSRVMLSNISHDLKTPLTAIKGYSEGLLDGVADSEEKRERYLKTIYAKACAMEELVEELSFFSKVDCEGIRYHFQAIPIGAYLNDCIEELSLDLELRGIRLHYHGGEQDDELVVIDPEQLHRVIHNIIGNSVKYMDKEQGDIWVRVLVDTTQVWISIEDNGAGIRQKDLPRIFDRFYRGDSARGTKKGGTGLGLSIVKSIVEGHGGRIEADSLEGKGTTIRFSVPRKLEQTEELEETAGKKVLWIKS